MAQIYNANPNLKAIGVSVQFTQEQIQEIVKCRSDYIYFIETYCQIVTLDHGLQLFKLYECQKKKLKIIHENRKVILMEGRQQGKTTSSAAYILWYTLFQEAKTVAILANKATAAREVLARYQVMYEGLPIWLQQGVKSWNKGDVELENGSKVFTSATSTSGIRGKSVNLLYVDEAAIIPNTVADQFFTSVYPTISAGETTKILLSSTPLGYNHFWKFWNDAENGRNGFVNCFIPYWEIPGRTKEWADEQKGILGDLKFNQEVLCKFLGSALTLINADVIGMMSPSYPIYSKDGLDVFEEPVYEEDTNKIDPETGKKIFKPPHSYVLVADVASGIEQDYSAFTVIDITTAPYKIVAKFRKNDVSALLYPNFIYKVAKEYNNAYILIEINIGEQVANILHHELEYDNLLFVNRNTQGQTVSGGFGGGRAQLGVVTDRKVKRIGCMNLKTLIEEQKLLIPDADIISEITTFIEYRGSYAADDGYNDDLVMTLVLFGWLTTQPYFKDLNDINLRDLIYRTRIKAIEDELTPFGFIADGQSSEEPVLHNF
jgi:hypothetical protein